jgi:hypothetical protein
MACQLAGLAAMPVAVCQMTDSTSTDAMMATCDHGPNVECPMHKHQPASSSSSSSSSRSPHENGMCRGCDAGVDYILTTLITFAGPLTNSYKPAAPQGVSPVLASTLDHFADASRFPLSPPPRS